MTEDMSLAFQTSKKQFILVLLALILGAVVGGVIWLFFKVMDMGLDFFWITLPSYLDIPYYPVIVCTLGGIIIGFWHKKFGDYPEELEQVITKVKTQHKYEYGNILAIAVASLLPLIFGGSIGPEAGLAGVVAALCTWVRDRFQYGLKELKDVAQIGISAALGIIFSAPLFGFMAPIESDDNNIIFPSKAKVIIYFAAIFGGLGFFLLLKELFGGGMSLGYFDTATIGLNELLWFIPLAMLGTVGGQLYYIFDKLMFNVLKPVLSFNVLCSALGGLLLGICGLFLPFTMFAGESQMTVIMAQWTSMAASTLLLIAFFKLIVINICIHTGWKGGNIFPLIFSGICLGYAMALLTGIDSVFAVAVITASLCGAVMRKPIAVILVLMLCFPLKGAISMSAAAFIGACIPLPAVFKRIDN